MTIAIGEQILAADVNAIKAMTEAHKTRHQSGGADELITTGFFVSDTLRNSNDGVKTTAELGYTKIKEVLLNADLGACRLMFDLLNTAGVVAYAKVYKNDVAIGAEQSNDTTAYVTKSEDFAGFVLGDKIQIYAKSSANEIHITSVRNMRFYYDKHITHIGGEDLTTDLELTISAISVTNQDP